jgi:hypothetical protein
VEQVLSGASHGDAAGEDLRADRVGRGEVEWFTSGTPQHMQSVGSRLWGLPIAAGVLPA